MRDIGRLVALAVVVLGATPAWARWGAHVEVVTTRDIPAGGVTRVVVDSSAGGIEVEPGSGGSIHVEERRHAENDDAARALPVTVETDRGEVRIRWHDERRNLVDTSIDFRVKVPAGTRVSLRTGGGGITIEGLGSGVDARTGGGGISTSNTRGDVKLESGGGGLHVRDHQGNLEARTGGGGIDVEGTLRGNCRFETGGGGISASLPASTRLRVDASTGGGSISNDFGLPVDDGWGSARMRGTIGDGSDGSLSLRSGGGSIRLRRR